MTPRYYEQETNVAHAQIRNASDNYDSALAKAEVVFDDAETKDQDR